MKGIKTFVVSLSGLFIACFMTFSSSVYAVPVSIDTSLWTDSASPSTGSLSSSDVWVRLHQNTPTKLANSSGALISNFSINGDFTFSGIFSPTYAFNSSCVGENTCNDDDILGLVFGWQDASNHFRLGWSQGDGQNPSGLADVTGNTGLFLVKEVNGVSRTIQSWANDFWLEDIEYKFTISRINDAINVIIDGIMSGTAGTQGSVVPTTPPTGIAKLISYNFTNADFNRGNVGIYTESQTAVFKSLNVTVPLEVSTPAVMGLFLLASLLLFINRRVLAR